MCLGLPLRTMITATDSVTKPCVAFWFQLADDQAGLDELFDVRFQREVDDVGVQPVGHRAALFAGGSDRTG